MQATKLWAHSGDSHFLEPEDLWFQILPAKQAERMPRSEKISDTEEIIHIDGKSFRRALPKLMTKKGADGLTIVEASSRPPGARDVKARLHDLDHEGIWGEVVYSSIGLWSSMIEDPQLVREAAAAENDWLVSEIQGAAPERLVAAALMPLLEVGDAVSELHHAADIGLKIVSLPTTSPPGTREWNDDYWEPLWAAAEEAGTVIGFHIGTESTDKLVAHRGPGGAILNLLETSYGGQRAAAMMVSGGALDRHPNLKVLISEGGATWVPFVGDRLNEGYRQHGAFVRPKLSREPKQILYDQVYASFQHDESAPAALWAMGYRNVMFGSDYPHLEGTYGHTQETLHGLFDELSDDVRYRITRGAFEDLFPHVSSPPA